MSRFQSLYKKINIELKRAINVKKNTDVKGDGNVEYTSKDEVFSSSEIKHQMDNNAKSNISIVFIKSMLDEFDPMMK